MKNFFGNGTSNEEEEEEDEDEKGLSESFLFFWRILAKKILFFLPLSDCVISLEAFLLPPHLLPITKVFPHFWPNFIHGARVGGVWIFPTFSSYLAH